MRVFAAGILVTCLAFGQQQVSREELERVISAQRHLLADWAGLNKYGSDNTEVKPPAPGEERVIFFGDDATAKWAPFFPGKAYFNRGVARQSTPQGGLSPGIRRAPALGRASLLRLMATPS